MSHGQSAAETLYQNAKRHQQLDKVYTEFQQFEIGFGGRSAFLQLMLNDGIANENKQRFFEDIIRFFSDDTKQFFEQFLSKNDYVGLSRSILAFEQLYQDAHVVITAAVALTTEQVTAICTKLASVRQQAVDTYEVVIDPQVIGGVKVQMGEWSMDNTLQTQLDKFVKTV